MGKGRRLAVFLFVGLIAAGAVFGLAAYRSLVTELAASTASDLVVQAVNGIVRDCMESGMGDGLVTLDKNESGAVTAAETNVAAVNVLAAEVLRRAVNATEENDLSLSVPLGHFFGVPVFSVPVSVKMLSSSAAGFRSELDSAGVNQTRHRLILELTVEASLFMPWRVVGISTKTEILLSDTVIVGEVPGGYVLVPGAGLE